MKARRTDILKSTISTRAHINQVDRASNQQKSRCYNFNIDESKEGYSNFQLLGFLFLYISL